MTMTQLESPEIAAPEREVLVSVVIPAYNPGSYLVKGLLRSLACQTLDEDQFEIIVVDDGSTDRTLIELEKVARRMPNLQFTSIPNSGWPGRPRNVGAQLATGRYVFYSDQDDAFFPDALRRLVEFGDENNSDIVYGKVVRSGHSTPYWSLWGSDFPHRDDVPVHLLTSRTVHKLFRRKFLLEHGLSFPEGPVRLEDHLFMGKAVPLAKNIAVLSSYPCYRWIQRSDGTNNSDKPFDIAPYWEYFSEAVREYCTRQEPGAERDRGVATCIVQAFFRIPPAKWKGRDLNWQKETFAALNTFFAEFVDESVLAEISVFKRIRTQAILANNFELFDQLQKWKPRARAVPQGLQIQRIGPELRLSVQLMAPSGVDPVVRETPGAKTLDLCLPEAIVANAEVPLSARLLPQDAGHAELTIRHRGTDVEWPLVGACHIVHRPRPDGAVDLDLEITAVINVEAGVLGQEIQQGKWDVLLRQQFLGEGGLRKLPIPAGMTLPMGQPLAERTPEGTLALTVGIPPMYETPELATPARPIAEPIAEPSRGRMRRRLNLSRS